MGLARKFLDPSGRPRRNLAILRRRKATLPKPVCPQKRCAACSKLVRLVIYGEDENWYCRLCWDDWYRRHQQWYIKRLQARARGICTTCGCTKAIGWRDGNKWHCEDCWVKWYQAAEAVATACVPCASGCGYLATWHPTHCCKTCASCPGSHGQHCSRLRPDGFECQSCGQGQQVGWWGDTTWHCKVCWELYYDEHCEHNTAKHSEANGIGSASLAQPLEEFVCQSCRKVQLVGWWGYKTWHCKDCWDVHFAKHNEHNVSICSQSSSMGPVSTTPPLEEFECQSCRKMERVGWWGYETWHCKDCWDAYFAKDDEHNIPICSQADDVGLVSIAPLMEGHFDFVEIGTSYYNTFVQTCAGCPHGKPGALSYLPKDRHLLRLRGLAVDMQQRYLDQLPNLPNVTKVCAAVSEFDGAKKMHHVPSGALSRWESIFVRQGKKQEFNSLALAHGCSSLGRHRVLRKVLGSIGLKHLICKRIVPVISIGTLLRQQHVASMQILALDCEGHDCAILRGLLRVCDDHPNLYPQVLMFETNGLNDEIFGKGTEEKTVEACKSHGYVVECSGWNTIMRRA